MIRQFDVVANPDPSEAANRPYVISLQSDLLRELRSTVVAPLVPRDRIRGAQRLNPIVTINGSEYWLATHEMFAIDKRMLNDEPVTNLGNERENIVTALDFVFTGLS